ncbi:IS3 family transposase, partial [Desulfobacula phenolica]
SGFYQWRNRIPSARSRQNDRLKQCIFKLFSEHNGMAGSPMITADLHDDPDFCNVSENRVARLMRKMGLKCKTLKKWVVTTDSKHNEPVAPNLLNRKFDVKIPNTVWVSDITYLKVGRHWYYLTVFIDLFSRSIVGWDLSRSLERHSVIRALKKAIMRRQPGRGLMIHSDRGVQYASQDFKKVLNTHGYIQSISRKGNCWDNAVAESFFHTLKTQLIYHIRLYNFREAERILFKYIEIYYNQRRKHSTNGWKTPAHCEQEWYNLKKVA